MQLFDIEELEKKAFLIHQAERKLSLESVDVVIKLEEMKANELRRVSLRAYVTKLGLTIDSYWKRVRAGQVLQDEPELRTMVLQGETCISHVAMLKGKLTPENRDRIFREMRFCSKSELRSLLEAIQADGTIDENPMVTVSLRMRKSDRDILERAHELQTSAGNQPDLGQVVAKVAKDYVDRHDPLRRQNKRKKSDSGPKVAPVPSRAVSAKIRNEVFRRDQGQCQHRFADGQICGEKKYVEVDHMIPFARGGKTEISNLQILCRRHNLFAASEVFGADWMDEKRRNLLHL